jgi:hypothetical protein
MGLLALQDLDCIVYRVLGNLWITWEYAFLRKRVGANIVYTIARGDLKMGDIVLEGSGATPPHVRLRCVPAQPSPGEPELPDPLPAHFQEVCGAMYAAAMNINAVSSWIATTEGEARLTSVSTVSDLARKNRRGKYGPSPATIIDCRKAVELWLDQGVSFSAAAQLVDRDKGTVSDNVYNVLRMVDEDTRNRWESKLRAMGKHKFLGEIGED